MSRVEDRPAILNSRHSTLGFFSYLCGMSSPYIVSARKYRPTTFASVVGQTALTRTLRNAIASGRLAQAYLFCGPRGVGKTSCARIFAKTINCEHRTPDGEACGQCDSCRDFERGVSYNVIELDAASNNGVGEMRSLTEQVQVPPATGRYRVFIIDEVHMLSTGAFNAFLKTLEEPPSYAVFILATTEKNKVLPTILSRCQTYDFARITERDIAAQLRRVAEAEGITAEDTALEVIARKADGAMRDALSIFDQVAAASAGNVTYQAAIANLNVLDYETYFRFTDAFARACVQDALLLYGQVRDAGFDSRFFVNGLAEHVRNLLVAQAPETLPLLGVGEQAAGRYTATARDFDPQWYYRALELLQQCDLDFREATDKQLLVELALIRLCQLRAPGAPTPEPATPIAPIGASPSSAVTPTAAPAANAAGAPTPSTVPPVETRPGASATTQARPATHFTPLAARPQPRPRPAVQSVRLSDLKQKLHQEQNKGYVALSQSGAAGAPGRIPTGDLEDEQPPAPEALQKAWQGYMDANGDKKFLLTAMRRGLPAHLGACRYELVVDNPAMLQDAEMHVGGLAEYLRSATGCRSLTIQLREQAPERIRHLTPAEQLRQLVEANPDTARLLDLLDAELA